MLGKGGYWATKYTTTYGGNTEVSTAFSFLPFDFVSFSLSFSYYLISDCCVQAVPYKYCWDGRTKYGKAIMPRYEAKNLATGDIVLIDLKIYRTHRNLEFEAELARSQSSFSKDLQSLEPLGGAEQAPDNRGKPWVHWNAQFQLHSVTLLWKAPERNDDSDFPDDDIEA